MRYIIGLITILFTFNSVYADTDDIIYQVYKKGTRTINVRSIPEYQLSIYKKMNLTIEEIRFLHTITLLECGKSDGLCLSKGKSDVGPFQINFINKEAFNYSMELYREQNSVELFRFQAQWTLDRSNRLIKQFKITDRENERVRQLAILHNGNNRMTAWGIKYKYLYGIMGVDLYSILKKHI